VNVSNCWDLANQAGLEIDFHAMLVEERPYLGLGTRTSATHNLAVNLANIS